MMMNFHTEPQVLGLTCSDYNICTCTHKENTDLSACHFTDIYIYRSHTSAEKL